MKPLNTEITFGRKSSHLLGFDSLLLDDLQKIGIKENLEQCRGENFQKNYI